MNARTRVLDDQILALLRSQHPLPMPTKRISEALAGERYVSANPYHDWAEWEAWRASPEGQWFVFAMSATYRRLCALARRGDVEKLRIEDSPHAYWRAAEAAASVDMAEFEEEFAR